ncbi:MAG: flagellar assembly protein FliW [Desulfovibrionaceae bacterium]
MSQEVKRVIMTRLGEREISEDGIMFFPLGLVGLEKHRRFVLLRIGENTPFLLLQCVDDPGLGLLVADPYPFVENYDVRLDLAEKRLLKLAEGGDMAVLVTVSIPKDEPEKATLNLSGPIVLNTAERLGLQVPQTDGAFPSRIRLKDGAPA